MSFRSVAQNILILSALLIGGLACGFEAIYEIKQGGKWRIWKNIDWLTHGLCRVGRHADDALNRYLIKSFVLQKTRQAGCIVAFCACRVLFMEPITVHAPTETVPGTPCPSPPRYPR